MPKPVSNEESPSALWEGDRRRFIADGAAAHALLKRANGEGSHLLALEIGEAVLHAGELEDDVPVRQQMARALAILGSSDEARALLEGIPKDRPDEAETRGLLARVWKDLAVAASDGDTAKDCFRRSLEFYRAGFDAAVACGDDDGAAYCGINAAALAVWLGDLETACGFAGKAEEHSKHDTGYYGTATRAEAALILGRDGEAEELYREASTIGERNKQWADIASTRKQCRALCLVLHGRRDHLDDCFNSGAVAILSGQPFPDDGSPSEKVIKDTVGRFAKWLEENSVRHAFIGTAPGWDLLLAEIALDRKIETHLILPYGLAAYTKDAIGPSGEVNASRFHKILASAASVTALGRFPIHEENGSRLFGERMVAARGTLLAGYLGLPLKVLVMGDDIAATALTTWHSANLEPFVIHPQEQELDGIPEKDALPEPVPFPRAVGAITSRQPVLAIVHLHFRNHSRLGGDALADFRSKVLEALSLHIAAATRPPSSTQGNGGDYSFAFTDLYAASEIALGFLPILEKAIEGSSLEMPSICLNAGPVSMEVNPLLHVHAPEGETVTRTAAIAALLPPGSVCATETFTALSSLESVRGFRFEHSGKIESNGASDRLFRLQPDT